ncbi:telomere length regulation protein [Paecilomyces lecythidis]|uniref:Small ribosomal subunit protein mS41 n=1 Tax=Paecilomyces lecythidis TaxID=3004212 RepID=A0ABR3WPG8_9EURO
MALRNPRLALLSSRFANVPSITQQCIRCLHKNTAPRPVPSPTPFVPDVPTFLTLIGRDMSKHASRLTSWEQLFTLSSSELRELGIEPARQRRYLLRQRERFRNGVYGPGGDLENVVDGMAQLRVVEVPKAEEEVAKTAGSTDAAAAVMASANLSPFTKRAIVNLLPDATEYKHDGSKPLRKFAQMKIHRGTMIKGPFLKPIKGSNGSAALIQVQEGMWEDKQGHKVDGGERRRAEVRAKKRSEERRKGTA